MSGRTPAILVCFDAYYAPAAGVALNSLFRTNPDLDYDLYAAVSDSRPEDLRALEALGADFGRSITYLKMEEDNYAHFKTFAHLTQAAYFRILAVDLIPADTILYLDVDLIVQVDLAPLFDLDLGDDLVGGVAVKAEISNLMQNLDAPPDEPYLNSGVLLINASLWRQQDTTSRLLDYYERYREHIRWVDQDVINGCLVGQKLLLDNRWNTTFNEVKRGAIKLPDFDADRFSGIFHFTSAIKPWHAWFDAPYAALYRKYANTAPLRMSENEVPKFYKTSLLHARVALRRRRPATAVKALARALLLFSRGVMRVARRAIC